MLRTIILTLAGLVGLLAMILGLRWLFDPAAAAAAAGMPLLEGIARSSQIGDLGALLLVSGGFTLVGIVRRQPQLLYTPLFLLGTTAIFRVLAAVFSGAAFATTLIGIEIVLCIVIFTAQRQLIASKA